MAVLSQELPTVWATTDAAEEVVERSAWEKVLETMVVTDRGVGDDGGGICSSPVRRSLSEPHIRTRGKR